MGTWLKAHRFYNITLFVKTQNYLTKLVSLIYISFDL